MCIKILIKSCGNQQKALPLHSQFRNAVGAIAQLVEQRTENPCVPGSIPGGTTTKRSSSSKSNSFLLLWCFGVANPSQSGLQPILLLRSYREVFQSSSTFHASILYQGSFHDIGREVTNGLCVTRQNELFQSLSLSLFLVFRR